MDLNNLKEKIKIEIKYYVIKIEKLKNYKIQCDMKIKK